MKLPKILSDRPVPGAPISPISAIIKALKPGQSVEFVFGEHSKKLEAWVVFHHRIRAFVNYLSGTTGAKFTTRSDKNTRNITVWRAS